MFYSFRLNYSSSYLFNPNCRCCWICPNIPTWQYVTKFHVIYTPFISYGVPKKDAVLSTSNFTCQQRHATITPHALSQHSNLINPRESSRIQLINLNIIHNVHRRFSRYEKNQQHFSIRLKKIFSKVVLMKQKEHYPCVT